ncbi:MAG: amidohydrolase family protein [Rhodobacteraceae bacterium]|nr:amidohydrolase family protein [Paracoccaceae bacterium]
MRIDAHQHFWTIARGDYGWLTPAMGPIYRDFAPADLAPLLERAGIEGTVLVQAAPTRAETDFLLKTAAATPFVLGVVGWAEFQSPDAADDIAALAREPDLVGLRPMIQDIPDPDWMLRPDLAPAFGAMSIAGLTFDALTLPRHLGRLRTLLAQYPSLRTVIDHGSKPRIEAGDFDDWARDMAGIARDTTAFCKLSGLVTEAGADWTVERLRPYVDHLLETFGPMRLIWGSDWPVCTLAASYERWLETTGSLLDGLDKGEHAAIMGGNAITAYNLGT